MGTNKYANDFRIPEDSSEDVLTIQINMELQSLRLVNDSQMIYTVIQIPAGARFNPPDGWKFNPLSELELAERGYRYKDFVLEIALTPATIKINLNK